MKQAWTKGLEPELQKEIRMAFKSSLILRKRLAEIIRDKEASNYRKNLSSNDYENPNWAYLKADSIGYANGLRAILELIEEN